MCVPAVRRRVPINYIVLLIFTITFSYFVMCGAINYGYRDPQIVYTAAVLTWSITAAVTLFACLTKTSFKIARGMMFVIGMAMFWMIILSLCFNVWLNTFYCTLCVILYGLYLLVDTSFIIGKG